MGHPYLFNPAIALPTTLARWDVGSGLVSAQIGTGRGADLFPYPTFNFGATHAIRDASPPDSGPVPTSFVDGAASLAGSDYDCLSPAPTENRSRGQRASTVSTDITEPDPANSTPSTPLRQSIASKPTPASFEVIAYDPTAEGKGKRSRKRSADDEVAAAVRAPSRTLMEVQKKGENGELQGAMITFGSRPNKRTAFSENKRRETAIARKDGVCDRCKKSKRKCDLSLKMSPYESCTLCLCTRTYKGVPRMPCSQSAIKEVVFFRKGPAPNEPLFTSRRILFDLRDISKPNVAVKTLELTQKPGRHGPSLTVYASEFSPLPEDVISYKWKDTSGKAREMTMPLFCLTNLDKVTKQFRQYIEVANRSYMDALRTEDKLAWETFSMAMNHSEKKPKSLVSIALDLWAISRMIETPWQMCGSDTLGVSRINDPTNPHDGAIPIPPIMDTQLDQIVIQNVLLPLRNELVSKFDNMTAPPKPEDWFEIYLTAFILLNHIARLAKHSVAHAKLHTMPTKYSNKEFLEGAFHTAKIILARFHFVCNGSAPLRLNWKLPTTCAMANLEPDQVAFMETTQAAIRSRENDLRHLLPTHEYENPLYWSHQLFFKEWDKSPACVVEAY
ncbi:hypothetical protein B0T26DRAFT_643248 [Lasiosphaeria miniovina]|uniref:Zn(2)-C6 fungal-type domain-containing protein n=1 Tax=Lasiosphaeria miniovina TaxID=1954250 RepID=A0AA40ATZ0_9PEZI|nr:uncharacterized protein B0T26DRAFT_643248 [Lasiosphaeria miniovina]KAK0721967.1 hypothetical protein B0T26DRAFT_643248 [Lasiosphaeria miniovina]